MKNFNKIVLDLLSNMKIKLLMSCLIIAGSLQSQTVTGTYPGPNLTWPDGQTGLIGNIDANVAGAPGGATVTDVNVTLIIDHSWVGDLELTLISPDGTPVEFLNDPTCPLSNNSDNVDVVFDDQGAAYGCASVISDVGDPDDCSNDYLGGAAISGTIQTQLNNFSVFNGESVNGNWTLSVNDDAAGDGGCLIGYSVEVTYSSTVPTLGQWGLILLCLSLLTFGVVALRIRETSLSIAGGSQSYSFRRLPFSGTEFRKMLVIVMISLAAVFAAAIGFFGYEMTAADVPGSLVCGPLLAYLLHLLVKKD